MKDGTKKIVALHKYPSFGPMTKTDNLTLDTFTATRLRFNFRFQQQISLTANWILRT